MKITIAMFLTLTAGLALGTVAGAEETSKAQRQAAEADIDSTYRVARDGCDALAGNTKDICVAEAKGKASIARAELVERSEPSAKHDHAVGIAKAEAAYAVAVERCDDKGGNDKDVCVKEAKAAKVRAVAEAKTRMTSWKAHTAVNAAGAKASAEVTEAKRDAASDERDANYAVAKAKCDVLAGDTKGACLDAAKTRFAQH